MVRSFKGRLIPDQAGGYVTSIGHCCQPCYDENTFECCACGEYDSTEQQKTMLVIAGDVRFLHAGKAKPGLYHVTELPYYGGPLIGEGYLYDDSLEYLCDLPPDVDTGHYPCGHLCGDCQKIALGDVGDSLADRIRARIKSSPHRSRKQRYDRPIKFRVGSFVHSKILSSQDNPRTFLVVSHCRTGESGKSPGAHGIEIRGGQLALHSKWLGPETRLIKAEGCPVG